MMKSRRRRRRCRGGKGDEEEKEQEEEEAEDGVSWKRSREWKDVEMRNNNSIQGRKEKAEENEGG